jgi:hypothetical protein
VSALKTNSNGMMDSSAFVSRWMNVIDMIVIAIKMVRGFMVSSVLVLNYRDFFTRDKKYAQKIMIIVLPLNEGEAPLSASSMFYSLK